jgi:hypothetical protein
MATGRVPTTANSPLTAKGDLFGYSTTQARVAVGNNGETLVADSSTSTGLRYTAGTVQSNPVLNSAMQNWQRGTSFTAVNVYTADRWWKSGGTESTLSRQVTNDTTNLPNIQYCVRYQRNSGSILTTAINLSQSMETVNSIPFAGKTVTLSFYARAGANYSATGNSLTYFLVSGTGTDQNQRSGYTGQATPINTTATLTTTWQRFSATGTVATTATELAVSIQETPVGTAGADDYFEVTGVQIDIGSVALPFRTYAGTIQGELAACQRYYYKIIADGVDRTIASGFAVSTTVARGVLSFPVTMRTTPTALEQSGTAADYNVARQGPALVTCSAVPSFQSCTPNTGATVFTVASGLTAGEGIFLRLGVANSYLAWSAEL